MKRWLFAFVAALLGLSLPCEARSSRTVVLDGNEVAVIHTGIGYSTIIQFDSKPTSAVLGDQDAFKVEYVGNSLTVKPVLPSSRTNLFAFTDYDRFNFKLETTRGSEVDYLVVVKRKRRKAAPTFISGGPAQPSTSLTKQPLHLSSKRQGVTLQVSDLAHSMSDGVFVVSFSLTVDQKSSKSPLVFEPGDIEIFQGKKSIPIENLYLEALSLVPGRRVRGKLLTKETNMDIKQAISFQFSPSALSVGKKPPQVSFPPAIGRK